ncbi:MAG: glycosyltransferase [Chitinophagaceae bacterium]
MQKISATIITYNEEKNIRRCIESLHGIADEIIVVDSLSTDNYKIHL